MRGYGIPSDAQRHITMLWTPFVKTNLAETDSGVELS